MEKFNEFIEVKKAFENELKEIILNILSSESDIAKEEIVVYIEFQHNEIAITLRNKIKSLIPDLQTSNAIKNLILARFLDSGIEPNIIFFYGDGITYYKDDKNDYFENLIEIYYFEM